MNAIVRGAYDISLTPTASNHGWILNRDTFGESIGYEIPIYLIVPNQVTGIRTIDDWTALVDFEAKPGEILEAGSCVFPGIEEKKHLLTFKYRAEMALFDDGWRVESVSKKESTEWKSPESARTLQPE